jgi:maltose alpha-D-glucosyltransferase/alpha-amylase
MALNFPLNQAMFLALARGEAAPLAHAIRSMPEIPEDCQWANFVRNHDELTLDKLSDDERAEVFAAFGPEEDHQLFGRGLRRRVPTMLDGDQARIRMLYSLAFSLPGTPILFYGEEIGMAENLAIPGRMSVRAPMQWSSGPNGGFSTAPADELRRPVVTGKRWGPSAINVADQKGDPDSLLTWMERLIRTRRETPEIVFGEWSAVPAQEAAVLALRYEWGPRHLLVLHNLSDKRVSTSLKLDAPGWGQARGLFGEGEYVFRRKTLSVDLPPFGLRWLGFRSEA